jgi:hypothetical protein
VEVDGVAPTPSSEGDLPDTDEREAKRLEGLGYEQQLKREFGFWHAAAVGFADISPIVAMYGMFSLALGAAGPAMFWGLFLVLAGMTLVAAVFGEISSRWPLAGGVYQWTRQQVGTNWAWFGGWAYWWTMVMAMTTCAYAAATYVAAAAGWSPSKPVLILLALGWIVFGTFANTIGQWVLKLFVTLSICAEFLASIILGLVLIIGYRVNPLSVLTHSFMSGGGSFNWVTLSWLGAVAFIGWSFLGFEASGAIAEEVKEPERTVPKTILVVLLAVGAVVIFTSLAWILALPNIKAAMTGGVADPMVQTLQYHLGTAITKPILCLIALGFTASMVRFADRRLAHRVLVCARPDDSVQQVLHGTHCEEPAAGPGHHFQRLHCRGHPARQPGLREGLCDARIFRRRRLLHRLPVPRRRGIGPAPEGQAPGGPVQLGPLQSAGHLRSSRLARLRARQHRLAPL